MANLYQKVPSLFILAHQELSNRQYFPESPSRPSQYHSSATATSAMHQLHSVRFDSLKDLEAWSAAEPDPVDVFRVARVSLASRAVPNNHRSVMVVHDFQNGYNKGEDDCPWGYYPHHNGVHYKLQFPGLVDTFVYFSHHRVTVPPVSWINSLHGLGVPVLGTLIFEDDELDDLLVKRDGEFVYSRLLVKLAAHYGFDGWLINVETLLRNKSPSELVLFISDLRTKLHIAIPHSKVVWYDSFVSTNRISYQNGVNERNYDHYENTDLFLTNYWWKEETLRANVKNIGSLGLKRLLVGVDVWGRGSCIGKGGLDIGTSLELLRVYSSNVGIFAPAWTYEKNFDDYEECDKQFWVGEPTKDYPNGGVSTYISGLSAPVFSYNNATGFFTVFGQGEGHFFNVCGEKVYNTHWVNNSLQTSMPLNYQKYTINRTEAFFGGSCVQIDYSMDDTSIDLFKIRADASSGIAVSLAYKQLEFTQDQITQLEISYYVERRYKSVTKVKSGVFKLPLKNTTTWNQLTTKFNFPRLGVHEHLVIDTVSVRLLHYSSNLFKSWIILPMNHHKLLLGYLVVTSADHDDTMPVTRISKKKLDKGQVLVQWKDYENSYCWLVYVNSSFCGAYSNTHFIASPTDRIRVDTITRFGVVLQGTDLFI